MSYRSIATANAIVSVVLGAIALVVPDVLAALYGITADSVALLAARLLGGSYVGYAIVDYLTRDAAETGTRRAIAAANGVAWAAGLVVSAYGQSLGLSNGVGWITVAMQLAFTAAWGRVYLAEGAAEHSRAMPAH